MQRQLCKEDDYNISGFQYAELVAAAVAECGAGTVLDYGAGAGSLTASIGKFLASEITLVEYDPAIAGKDAPPPACDLVACLDVLPCVEPDRLEAVLDDLHRVTRRFVFIAISERRSGIFGDDGEDAYRIIEDSTWWLPRLWSRFRIYSFSRTPNGFWLIGLRNDDYNARLAADGGQ